VLTVLLLVLAVVWRPWPIDVAFAVAAVVGGLIVVAGIALAAPGFLPFASVQQLYGVKRGGLITGGPYRYSRNPQYAGLGIALVGVAVIARSAIALLVVAMYWVAIRTWIVVEEEHLDAAFGAQYAAYRQRAPRFLGRRRGG
jgi:protein-S-isoprenylcysteine O-methyltransferase Ste14